MLLSGPHILKGKYRVVRHFYRRVQLDYVFGINESENQIVNRLLREEAGPGNGIINLKLRRDFQFVDGVVGVLTLGIYARSWLSLEGDVIRWAE